ncbi:MAG: efflux RND transporter periplasmic adaptor subunit [Acidobacteria bacterium]|nr:efflux RND transporter periplasmic adaptor subunit [Acidobacteriota bacterium]
MVQRKLNLIHRVGIGVSALLVMSIPAGAQDQAVESKLEIPTVPVRYTVVREHLVRRTIQLPGTVESRTRSLIASEVPGLVTELKVREGEGVRKGQALLKLRTTSLELRLKAAQAQLKEAESRQSLAERSLGRARELFDSQAFSQQQLDESFYEFSAWQGRVETLQAQIAQIEFDVKRSTIRAPFDGVIVARHTDVGEWRGEGDAVLEILSLDALEVNVEVPERYFGSLKLGVSVAITFEALPDLLVEGDVRAIIPRADPQARTFPVKIRIPDADRRVGVGMLAGVSLPVGESYRATVVPKDAVVAQGPGRAVYMLNGGDVASLVPVRTGAGVGPWIVIEGDVRAGQKVIVRGNERLFPDQPVRAEPLEYPEP